MKITKKLTDICLPKQWKTLSLSDLTDGGYLCYGANGIIGHYKEYNHEDEVIMIGCRGSCGSVNISEPKSYINGNAMCLENVDKDVIPKYLYYFLKSCDFGKVITGTSQPQITRTSLSRLDVVIYDMDTQKEIVSILDNVSGLIALTDECISLLENLAMSQFVEMFGKQNQNHLYIESSLSSVCSSIVRGPFGSSLKKEYFVPKNGNTYKVYEQQNAIKKDFSLGNYYISSNMYVRLKRFSCQPGDILMSCSGTIGELYVLPPECEKGIINQALCKFTLNHNIVEAYFLYAFADALGSMDTRGTGIKNVPSVANIKNIKILLPPLKIQNEFSSFANQIDKSKLLFSLIFF